jgi:hypothetical protein
MADDLKTKNQDEPAAADPGPPTDWPKAGALSRALAWASWKIRQKNRQAQSNGGVRVPL